MTSTFKAKTEGGDLVRSVSGFRNWITADGSVGSGDEGRFIAEPDRYHLYISL